MRFNKRISSLNWSLQNRSCRIKRKNRNETLNSILMKKKNREALYKYVILPYFFITFFFLIKPIITFMFQCLVGK